MRKGDPKTLEKAGKALGREGLSLRAIACVERFNADPSYKNAIILAGELNAIAYACRYDDYWGEKAQIGYTREFLALADIAKGNI